MCTVRLAGIIEESYTDGLGIRYTMFFQGCKHCCPECHNMDTWNFDGGKEYNIEELVREMAKNPLLDGVTMSGGDPFYQIDGAIKLAELIREKCKDYSIWVYTGFLYEELLKNPRYMDFLSKIDVLVDGPFEKDKKSLSLAFRGSSNQRIIDVQASLKSESIVVLNLDTLEE